MDAKAIRSLAAIETLKELDRRGYVLDVKTRVEVHDHKVGAHAISYGDKLLVSGGPGPLDDALRAAVKLHQPYLLAAACVRMPPVTWLDVLVSKYRLGKVPARTLAANLAAFLGKSPVQDGLDLVPIVEEAA
jgi:hypothetical protein